MLLQIHHQSPGLLTCTMAAGTLRQRHQVAYAHDRVSQVAGDVLEVLQRGNRTHRLTEENIQQLRLAGEELARRLLPSPILSEIKKSMGSLTLELDAELLWIPWELLYDGEQFLCRRFDMGRLVRTSMPLRSGTRRSSPGSPMRLLILTANPAGDLPQAEREGMEILTDLDKNPTILARVLAEPKVEQVRREFKDHDMVHFAGHVDILDQGWGWRLMDGHLADTEAASMGAGRPMPMLVFSNGCHSGRFAGTQDNLFGPAQAFLMAGVRHYIGTFWELVDGQGAQFARHFYLDLSRGATMGAAVRNARNRVIAESGEAELAWAAYVLYGNPEHSPVQKQEPKETWSDTDMALKLGVRATAPYKPKPRKGAAAEQTAAPSLHGNGGRFNWTAVLLSLLAVVSLGTILLLGLLYRRMETLSRPTPSVPSAPHASGKSQTTSAPPQSPRSPRMPSTGPSDSDSTKATRPQGLAVSIAPGPPGDRAASDAAALLASCITERLSTRYKVLQPNHADRPGTGRVVVAPHRLKGRLFLTVTTTAAGRILDTSIIEMSQGLDKACGQATQGIFQRIQ